MLKSLFTAAVFLTVSLGSFSSSAKAIGLLLPAVQKVREAAARPNADSDGDGIPDSFVQFGNGPSTASDDVYVEGKIITAENYDSAYMKVDGSWLIGKGEDTRLVMVGPLMIGPPGQPERAAVCYGVSVLAWARVEGSDVLQPVLTIETAEGQLILQLTLIF